jgi:hypothetical protein
VALVGLAALFLLGLFSSSLVVAGATPAAVVSLKLWPAGQGRIEATQNGQNVLTEACDFTTRVARGSAAACEATVTVGTPVTLKATADPALKVPAGRENEVPDFPVTNPAFVRWSKSECGKDATCTFTPAADSGGEWITALFTPLQLQVGYVGTGTLTFRASDGSLLQVKCDGAGFGDHSCHAALPADLDVVIEASPNPAKWGFGCEPEGASPTAPRCTLGMANLRSLASLSFDAKQGPPTAPFQLNPVVKVKLTGSGQGRVSGTGIDCPSTCQVEVDYQKRMRLTAQESPGSTFAGWVGVCSTDRTCAFNAGSANGIQARFDAVTTTTTATTTSTTTTATTATTGTTTTTTTTTPKPKPRLGTVVVRGHGSKRVVAFVVIVDRRGRATVRLVKQGKTSVSKGYALAKGRNAFRLQVPGRAKPGQYRLSVRVVVAGATQTVSKTLRIPR